MRGLKLTGTHEWRLTASMLNVLSVLLNVYYSVCMCSCSVAAAPPPAAANANAAADAAVAAPPPAAANANAAVAVVILYCHGGPWPIKHNE